MIKISCGLVLLLLLLTGGAYSQSTFRGWFGSYNTVSLSKKWSLHTDVQIRSSNEWQQLQMIIIRPGINYEPNEKVMLTVGYAFTEEREMVSGESGFVPNHRIWEQFQYKVKAGRLDITQRARIEQRFLPEPVLSGGDIKSSGINYANRFRYYIRNLLPLKSGSEFNKGIFLSLQDEVFLNFGNKANVNGQTFDQNRLYLSAGYRFSKKFDMDAGYLYQHIVEEGNNKSNNHILQLATYVKL